MGQGQLPAIVDSVRVFGCISRGVGVRLERRLLPPAVHRQVQGGHWQLQGAAGTNNNQSSSC